MSTPIQSNNSFGSTFNLIPPQNDVLVEEKKEINRDLIITIKEPDLEAPFTFVQLLEEVVKKGSIEYGAKSQSDIDGGGSMCATAVALALISLLKGDKTLEIDALLEKALIKYWELIHYLKGANLTNPQSRYMYGELLTWLQDILPKNTPGLFPELSPLEHLTGTINQRDKTRSFQKMIEDLASKIPPDENQIGGCLLIGALFCALVIKKDKDGLLEVHFFDSHKYKYLKKCAYHVSFQGPKAVEHLADFLALRFEENGIEYHLDPVRFNKELVGKSEIPPLNPKEHAAILCELFLQKESNKKEFIKERMLPLFEKHLPDELEELINRFGAEAEKTHDAEAEKYLKSDQEIADTKNQRETMIDSLSEGLIRQFSERYSFLLTQFIYQVLRKEEREKNLKKIYDEILEIGEKLINDGKEYEKNEIRFREDRISVIWGLKAALDKQKGVEEDTYFNKVQDAFLSLLLTQLETSQTAWENDEAIKTHLSKACRLLTKTSFSDEKMKQQWKDISLKINTFFPAIDQEIKRELTDEVIQLIYDFQTIKDEGSLKQCLFFMKAHLYDAFKELCDRFIPVNIFITASENMDQMDKFEQGSSQGSSYLFEKYRNEFQELNSHVGNEAEKLGRTGESITLSEAPVFFRKFREDKLKEANLSSFFTRNEDIDSLAILIMSISGWSRNVILELFTHQVLQKNRYARLLSILERSVNNYQLEEDLQVRHLRWTDIQGKYYKEAKNWEVSKSLDKENSLKFKEIASNFLQQSIDDLEAFIEMKNKNMDLYKTFLESQKELFDGTMLERWDSVIKKVNELYGLNQDEYVKTEILDKLNQYLNNQDFDFDREFFTYLKRKSPSFFNIICDKLIPINLIVAYLQESVNNAKKAGIGIDNDTLMAPFLDVFPELFEIIFNDQVVDSTSLIKTLKEASSKADSLLFERTDDFDKLTSRMMLIPHKDQQIFLLKQFLSKKESSLVNKKEQFNSKVDEKIDNVIEENNQLNDFDQLYTIRSEIIDRLNQYFSNQDLDFDEDFFIYLNEKSEFYFDTICDKLTPINLLIDCLENALDSEKTGTVFGGKNIIGIFGGHFPELEKIVFNPQVVDTESLIKTLKETERTEKNRRLFEKTKDIDILKLRMKIIPQKLDAITLLIQWIEKSSIDIKTFENRIISIKEEITNSTRIPFDANLDIHNKIEKLMSEARESRDPAFLDLNKNRETRDRTFDLLAYYLEMMLNDESRDDEHETTLQNIYLAFDHSTHLLSPEQIERVNKIKERDALYISLKNP